MKISLVELSGRISPGASGFRGRGAAVALESAGSMGVAAASRVSSVLALASPRNLSQSLREMKSLMDVRVGVVNRCLLFHIRPEPSIHPVGGDGIIAIGIRRYSGNHLERELVHTAHIDVHRDGRASARHRVAAPEHPTVTPHLEHGA